LKTMPKSAHFGSIWGAEGTKLFKACQIVIFLGKCHNTSEDLRV